MSTPPAAARLPQLLDGRWQIFMQVAQAGSLTGAAAQTGSAQSVISRQVAALEAECGARLFRRTGRGVVLTEFGQRVYPRVRAMLDEARRLGNEVQSARGLAMGDVRVGLLPFSVTVLAEHLYREVRARFPDIRLHLTEGPSAQLEEWLASGRLDMAMLLREGESTRPDAAEPLLARMALHLIGAADDPLVRQPEVAFAQLDGLPLVLPEVPHPLRAQLDQLAQQRQLRLLVAAEANSIALQKEIAAAGGCYAIVAGPAVATDAQARRLGSACLVAPSLWRSVVLATTPQRPDVLATREVRALLRQLCARHMGPPQV